MTSENVLEVMKVAHLVNRESLVETCLGFVLKRRGEKKLSMETIRASNLPNELMAKILELFW